MSLRPTLILLCLLVVVAVCLVSSWDEIGVAARLVWFLVTGDVEVRL